ncbi:MAG: DUF4835 family protein [Bacteroidota bacterium]
MKKIILLFLISLTIVNRNYSQELDATVVANFENLPVAAKDRLINFGFQVKEYLNNTKFTRQNWEGDKIKCNFNIFFTGGTDELIYNAQLVISSQRIIEGTPRSSLMLSIMDNSWQFKYERNQAMYFNQTDFDPLTSLLDYYAYIIIGFDLDSYYKLGGTEFFSKAFDITVKGASNQFADGWQAKSTAYNRRGLAENLVNAKYQQLRQDIFDYHYNGLDLYHSPQTKLQAQENMVKLIRNLDKVRGTLDPRSVFLKVFFDAKAGEFVEYLKDYKDKEIFNMLKRINASHISKYDEAFK